MGRIAVVDEQNRFVRWEERVKIHEQQLPHRSIHTLVFDERSRLVVQRRHREKQTFANYWDCSASGHVEEEDYEGRQPDDNLDAAYELTARREIEEELGAKAKELTLIRKEGPQEGVHYEQMYIYRARADGPFSFQKEELEEIQLMTEPMLRSLLESEALVTPVFRRLCEEMLAEGWPS